MFTKLKDNMNIVKFAVAEAWLDTIKFFKRIILNMSLLVGVFVKTQKITTKEPDDDMIEVAIASVEAVFDWKKWQEENL